MRKLLASFVYKIDRLIWLYGDKLGERLDQWLSWEVGVRLYRLEQWILRASMRLWLATLFYKISFATWSWAHKHGPPTRFQHWVDWHMGRQVAWNIYLWLSQTPYGRQDHERE